MTTLAIGAIGAIVLALGAGGAKPGSAQDRRLTAGVAVSATAVAAGLGLLTPLVVADVRCQRFGQCDECGTWAVPFITKLSRQVVGYEVGGPLIVTGLFGAIASGILLGLHERHGHGDRPRVEPGAGGVTVRF